MKALHTVLNQHHLFTGYQLLFPYKAIDRSHVMHTASQHIQRKPLHCYYAKYQNLAGNTLHKCIVNRIIQHVHVPAQINQHNALKEFCEVAQQIKTMGIHRNKDIWRLAAIIFHYEYDLSVSYFRWFVFNLYK